MVRAVQQTLHSWHVCRHDSRAATEAQAGVHTLCKQRQDDTPQSQSHACALWPFRCIPLSQCLVSGKSRIIDHQPVQLAKHPGRTEPVEPRSERTALQRQLTFTIPILALSVLSTTMMTAWDAL